MIRASFLAALGAAVAAVAVSAPASAQELNFGAIQPGQHHVLHVGAGFEDAAVTSLGYSYLLPWRRGTVAFTTALDLVPVQPGDWRLRTGASAPLAAWGGWMVGGTALGIARGASNYVNSMTNVGVAASAWAGFHSRRWFVAADAGVDWAAATYIEHTDRYRRLVYADARDGWYSSTGATFVYGVTLGWSFTDVDLVLRAGQRTDVRLDTWLLPFFATVGVNIRLPSAD